MARIGPLALLMGTLTIWGCGQETRGERNSDEPTAEQPVSPSPSLDLEPTAPGPEGSESLGASAAPTEEAPDISSAEASALRPPTTGEQSVVAAGTLRVGSLPGLAHRRPSVEADLAPLQVPSVRIDRLPYPNDPALPPTRVRTRAEALALCEGAGHRLCEELEWERGCRGNTSTVSPLLASPQFETCQESPETCQSPTGALAMGLMGPEWTASDAEPRFARLQRTAVVRGAGADAAPWAHRCGSRQVRDPADAAPLAFRCCSGPAPELSYPDVGLRRRFRPLSLQTDELRRILAAVPEVAAYAENFTPFDSESGARAIARGDHTLEELQWELSPGPFAWSPSPGEEVWVLAGDNGSTTILVALYPLSDGSFLHASSFVLEGEVVPVAILRTRTERDTLRWTTCFGCTGDSGTFHFEEDATILIVQG